MASRDVAFAVEFDLRFSILSQNSNLFSIYRPNLFIYKSLLSKSPLDNLEHAFTLAEKSFGVHKLLEPAGLPELCSTSKNRPQEVVVGF